MRETVGQIANGFEFRQLTTDGYMSDANGQSTERVTCPFCGAVTRTYVWSRCGNGKKCNGQNCGAVHGRTHSYKKVPK